MSTPAFLDRVLRFGEGKKMRRLEAYAGRIGELEPEVAKLTEDDVRLRVAALREEVGNGRSLDDVLPEMFALTREAGKRTRGMRHFDVQLMGGVVLHEGSIAEMLTGEGKTLVATLPLALNALTGRGCHLVTVNDYLAKRDAEWMRPIYEYLGLTLGIVQTMLPEDERRDSYAADITYGTNSEFGFDYLRDNMAMRLEDCVQRGHAYAIVDEVDSILIDEARTPLIISGQPEKAAETYVTFARIMPRLIAEEDYTVDEKMKTVAPTESGVDKVERALGIDNLYTSERGDLVNHLVQALRAQTLYKNDVEYVVADAEVKIVDEFTGRILEGRRYSEGLHQAIEAKEGVAIKEENQTLATITLQNYFRLYEKLAGMTGTAMTEASEFAAIYKLGATAIPPNRNVVRDDEDDLIYKTAEEKYEAVVEDIANHHEYGQPVLVGTISVDISEKLSRLLERRGVPHEVLNAKNHAREAQIIEQAGQLHAVTIATNMAGRGVDIKLADGVTELGGLYVLGTERHESRRIDNQLRGRSGRQGDPGRTRFYLSAEDDVIRLFSGDRIYRILDRLGPPEGEPIQHKMLSRTIAGAQKKVEDIHFQQRKRVLDYDDVMNKQRMVVYAQRREVLGGADIAGEVRTRIEDVMAHVVQLHCQGDFVEDWDLDGLFKALSGYVPIRFAAEHLDRETLNLDALIESVQADARTAYERREEQFGADLMRQIERYVLLQVLDPKWREHLYDMDYLREGIHLRGFAQKDPLVEYKAEGFSLFQELMGSVWDEIVRYLFHVEVTVEQPEPEPVRQMQYSGPTDPVQGADGLAELDSVGAVVTAEEAEDFDDAAEAPVNGAAAAFAPRRRDVGQVGRNDPCPCGSGKKFKRCHGAVTV